MVNNGERNAHKRSNFREFATALTVRRLSIVPPTRSDNFLLRIAWIVSSFLLSMRSLVSLHGLGLCSGFRRTRSDFAGLYAFEPCVVKLYVTGVAAILEPITIASAATA